MSSRINYDECLCLYPGLLEDVVVVCVEDEEGEGEEEAIHILVQGVAAPFLVVIVQSERRS